jgi:glutamyl-tRNA reductase
MTVWALGLNHTSASLDLRSRFAFASEQVGNALSNLRESMAGDTEATILSTCNRTEVYCAGSQHQTERTMQWLADLGQVSSEVLRAHTYCLRDEQVARHAFRVASGLDSMVLGEPQILGQLKGAVRLASEAGAVGTTLNQLFQRSFSVAKEVRSSTEIGAHSISMAAAAVRLASQLFEDLRETSVLFVGAGEMIGLCATHFAAKKPRRMVVANRTAANGERLAAPLGAEVMPLADLPRTLHQFDIVVSCTSSVLPLIGLGAVESALTRRRGRPMLLVDLAVPRDIEPQVKSLQDAYLYTVDDLGAIVQAGQSHRQAAVIKAEAIIETGVQSFQHWMAKRNSVPLIRELNWQAEAWRQHEMARAKKAIAKGEAVEEVIEALSRGLVNKLMHGVLAGIHGQPGTERKPLASTVESLLTRSR